MPDRLTPWLRAPLLLTLFALGGLAAGVAWEAWWEPATGVVVDGELRFDIEGLGREFAAPATFAVVSLAAGLLLGVLAVLLAGRDELLTLAVVVAGAVLAAVVTWQTGERLGPPDPAPLIAAAADGDRVAEPLELGSPGLLALWPLGSLLSAGLLFLLLPRPTARSARSSARSSARHSARRSARHVAGESPESPESPTRV